MNKIMKVAMSIVMSFAMAVCLVPTWAGAAEMHRHEDGVEPASIVIGMPYEAQDKYGKLTFRYSSQSTLVVTYTNFSNYSRYIRMYTSTLSKTFPVRKFVVKKKGAHSESYSINAGSGKVTVTVYRHTSSSPSSTEIDPFTAFCE